MKEYKTEVVSILESIDNDNSGLIKGSSLSTLLKKLLLTFNISMNEKDLFLFERMVENRYKQGGSVNMNKYKYLKLSYFQCISLIEEWALKESYKQVSLFTQIQQTISEYENLLILSNKSQTLSSNLSLLITSLKTLQIKPDYKPARDLVDLQMKGIKQIFEFYAKQIKMIGVFPTFGELTDHKTILNLSKFTKFCSDFELINTNRDKHKIPLKLIQYSFNKATNCQRAMNFTQFLAVLDLLADLFYSEQYDSFYNEKLSLLPMEEKRKRLLLLLHCEDPSVYSPKLKGFGPNFSLEKKGYRLPENDLSRNYKYKDQTKVKQQISL